MKNRISGTRFKSKKRFSDNIENDKMRFFFKAARFFSFFLKKNIKINENYRNKKTWKISNERVINER